MGLCQKITANRVLADQIFVIADDVLDCDLPFAAAAGATMSGALTVTVTELDFTTSGTALLVDITLMYQKELTVSGHSDPHDIDNLDPEHHYPRRPAFAPDGLPTVFPLEYKVEKSYTNQFCGVTTDDIANLGVKLADVKAELVRVVDVTDELEFTCGTFRGTDDPVIVTSGHIEDTVTSLVKIKLVTEEDLVVGLCPATHSKIVNIFSGACEGPKPCK
jgi:hypothetical protein